MLFKPMAGDQAAAFTFSGVDLRIGWLKPWPNDCTSEFDFCVAYLNGGRCVASADCAEGLDAVSFASIEGDVVRGCTTLDVRCGDNGLCG